MLKNVLLHLVLLDDYISTRDEKRDKAKRKRKTRDAKNGMLYCILFFL